jgi:hypothetical protein
VQGRIKSILTSYINILVLFEKANQNLSFGGGGSAGNGGSEDGSGVGGGSGWGRAGGSGPTNIFTINLIILLTIYNFISLGQPF